MTDQQLDSRSHGNMMFPAARTSGDENPFASQYVRPGAMVYVWPEGISAALIVERLKKHDWYGQILGPHGSGKTSLLLALITLLQDNGRQIAGYTLHADEVVCPRPSAEVPWRAGALVVVDGFEQLTRWQKMRLKGHCRRARCGLLVTAHEDVGLPPLIELKPSEALAWRLAEQLQKPAGPPDISQLEVAAAFQRHDGDLRETLFGLYDLYEMRRRAP